MTTVGRCELQEKLGAGPFGECWLAEHGGTRAVVKLFAHEVSASPAMETCLAQANHALLRTGAARIAHVLDAGRTHDGRAYIVREHVEGESLAQRIAAGRHSTTQLADVLSQCARLLVALHDVPHNDLKPSNIFIVKDDERASGEGAVIVDFAHGPLVAAFVDRAGVYRAPEQTPDAAPSWRIDAYALGCIAFELATQHQLRVGERPNLRSFVPEASAALDRLIARMMENDPLARPRSMKDIGKLFELMVGFEAPLGETEKAPPAFTDAQPNPATVDEVVEMRVGRAQHVESKALELLREGSRTAVEADRTERAEDARKLRQFAALQLVQAVEVALYRRITGAFPADVRARWVSTRRELDVDASNAMERAMQIFLERGDKPSLNLLGRMLKEPGPQPPALAELLRSTCRVGNSMRAHLFELGSIRNVLAHLPEYEEDATRSIDGPRGLFIEEMHDDGTRKLTVDPAYLVSLEQICRTLVMG